jgi:hypothetical protein
LVAAEAAVLEEEAQIMQEVVEAAAELVAFLQDGF